MKFATLALAASLVLSADAGSRSSIHRRAERRRRAATFGRNRPSEHHTNGVKTVSSSAIKTADFYPNSSFDDADERSCDGYYVKIEVDTDKNGKDTAVYLTSMDEDEDVAVFLLSAPMWSLDNNKDYGVFEYCLPQDSSTCYHLDVMSQDGKGCENNDACVTLEVQDEDGNNIEFKYDGSWHSKVEIDDDFGDFDAAAFCWGENDDCGDDSRNDNGSDSREDCDDEPSLSIDDTDSCDDKDMIEVEMNLDIKDGSEDISILLKEDSDKIWDYDEGCFKDDEYTWKTCVDETKCTKFKFYSKDGDFDGTLTLDVDGKEVQASDDSLDFNNNDVMIIEIGDCDSDDRNDDDAPTSIDDNCNNDEIEVKLDMKTDNRGKKDTAVLLTEGSKEIWEYKQGSFKDETRYRWTACVDEDKCTKFKFFDQDEKFDGDLTVEIDGTEVESGDSIDFISDDSGTPGIRIDIGDC